LEGTTALSALKPHGQLGKREPIEIRGSQLIGLSRMIGRAKALDVRVALDTKLLDVGVKWVHPKQFGATVRFSLLAP
jgi:hypothetical protein